MLACLWFLSLLALVIFVHELGHFLLARLFGIKVEVFSIGFGKPIYQYIDKHETKWRISYIPLGGYIKMLGAEGEEDKSAAFNKNAFMHKPLWQKFLVVLGGPLANYILAFLLLVILLQTAGHKKISTEITGIAPNSIAQEALLKVGDIITHANGKKVYSAQDVSNLLNIKAESGVILTLKNGDLIRQAFIQLHSNYVNKKIGVEFSKFTLVKPGIIQSLKEAMTTIYVISKIMLESLIEIISGRGKHKEIGGPIKIAQLSTQSLKLGYSAMIWLTITISLNLGIINLLPIPTLDGGYIFHYLIQGITGRKIPKNIRKWGMRAGVSLLILTLIFVTCNDLLSLIR